MYCVSSNGRPSVRVDGEIQMLDGEPLHGPNDVESLLLTMMPERNHEALRIGHVVPMGQEDVADAARASNCFASFIGMSCRRSRVRTVFSSPAIIWIGTGTSSALRPPRITAGIRGRSRPSRWSDWRPSASSGYCQGTVRECIYLLARCGSKSGA